MCGQQTVNTRGVKENEDKKGEKNPKIHQNKEG